MNVRRRGFRDLEWTWTDGCEFSLHFPTFTMLQKPLWQIKVDNRPICSGKMINRSFRDSILRAKLPFMEWTCLGTTIYEEPSHCSGIIRRADGRRLAVWRKRGCGGVVVCRDGTADELLPILSSIALINFWALAGPDGSCD